MHLRTSNVRLRQGSTSCIHHLRRPRRQTHCRALRVTPPDEGSPQPSAELAAFKAVAASISIGGALAAFGPSDLSLPPEVQPLSAFLGYSYASMWSLSFWPQVWENSRRGGGDDAVSLDYLAFSLLGYLCYSAYTWALLFDPVAQAAFASAHGGAASDVQIADFAFAAHATVVTVVTLAQVALAGSAAPAGEDATAQRLSPLCAAVLCTVAAVSVCLGLQTHMACQAGGGVDCASWLVLLSWLGGVKVAVTLIKYTPQLLLNFQRRSTDGWAIDQVLLDIMGGALSLGQAGVDAAARQDWGVLTGNPAKLGIASISIAFDLAFMWQHYVLFPGQRPAAGAAPALLPTRPPEAAPRARLPKPAPVRVSVRAQAARRS